MIYLTKKIQWLVVLLTVASLFLSACGSDEDDADLEEDAAATIDVPQAYVFDSRFVEGESSVAYSGQVVRNLLLQDLKATTDSVGKDGARPIAVSDMLKLYEYDDALNLKTLTTTGGLVASESHYSALSTGKNLVGKISDEPVIGYGRTADDLVREWFEMIADNSQDSDKLGTPMAYTTDDGVDMSQMVNKVLIGAVPYYQATGVYLNGLLERDNSEARDGTDPYTAMEHAWDEAFGYFGAARDYFRYTDEQLAGSVDDFTFDSNGDGSIDFKSEYNFGLSRNAAKRDKGGSGVDFTQEIFNAFLAGRTAITNQGSVAEISAHRQAAAEGMEKVIAATVVHYINDTLSDMSELGTAEENRANLNKHWAEMKGYTVALQYNPFRLITDGQLAELHGIMGEAPIYDEPGSNSYKTQVANYERAKAVLQTAYGFSNDNMANW